MSTLSAHQDASKTTLTEKLLLFGGAFTLAGEVKARGERRRVRSDWMAVERERGISVSSAIISFKHEGSPPTCWTRRATRISAQWDLSPLGFSEGHLPHPDRGPPPIPPPLAGRDGWGPLDAAPNGAKAIEEPVRFISDGAVLD